MNDVLKRIDEFLAPFIMGMKAGKTSSSGGRAKGSRMDDLMMDVIYHKEKDRKKAVDDVIKQKNLDGKTAKQLKKYIKKHLGK
jgi:hypothetical protein